jgi:hypothetical protein
VQVAERRKAAAMAALDKAEKKLSMARDELARAEAVLRFDSTQAALAERFRFDASGTVTHEFKEGAWVVRVPTAPQPPPHLHLISSSHEPPVECLSCERNSLLCAA